MKSSLHILMTIRLGAIAIGNFLWNLLLTPSPFAPVMLFYHVMPILLVYLYLSSPSAHAGLDRIADLTHLTWWFPSALFMVCAMIGYESRNPKVNAILVLPMVFYAIVILVTALGGSSPIGGLVTGVYMIVAAWSALGLIRYYQELNNLKLSVKALQQKASEISSGDKKSGTD